MNDVRTLRALAKAYLDFAGSCVAESAAQGIFAGLSIVHSKAADDLENQWREANLAVTPVPRGGDNGRSDSKSKRG